MVGGRWRDVAGGCLRTLGDPRMFPDHGGYGLTAHARSGISPGEGWSVLRGHGSLVSPSVSLVSILFPFDVENNHFTSHIPVSLLDPKPHVFAPPSPGRRSRDPDAMERLPPEIILEIVSHLVVEGEHKCAQACPYVSHLRNLAAASRRLAQIVTPFLYSHDAIYAGRAVLHGARLGSVRTIAHSLSLGGDVNRKSQLRLPGYKRTAMGTALHVAVREGHLAVVGYLLDHDAHPNLVAMDVCECQHGDHPYWPAPPWTALHLAMCAGHIDVAKLLVSRGAHLVLSREYLGTEVDEVSFMRGNVLVRRASRGVHLLDEVARRRSLRMFRFLLARHSDSLVFHEYPVSALTPLHRVARITDDPADLEMMRTLLDRGARLQPEGHRVRKAAGPLPFDRGFIAWVKSFEEARRGGRHVPGRHPYTQLLAFLRYFAEGGRPYLGPLRERVLELWMDRGPGRMDSGWSLLYQAFGVFDAAEPRPELVRRWVLESIRDPKLEAIGPMSVADVLRFMPKLGFDETLLHPVDELLLEAAGLGMAEECAYFVAHGARVGARDGDGRTALHLAARIGAVETVRLLLGVGADVEARDGVGDTAEGVARRYGRPGVVALLRGEGRRVGRIERRQDASYSVG